MKIRAHGFVTTVRHAALCTSGLALALGLTATAYAQAADEAQPATDEPAAEVDSGNEIVVTATKREQTLQDVPVAVSVTTAATLERAQIRDIKDLTTVVPSLRVTERQNSTNTNFLIRGFGNGANNAGIEPSVGVFVDGVYRSRSAAQIGDFPDVQRIEVLRGPQSTLFGKNASAGVISIVTALPKFTFGGNVEASYGNYNALVLKGVVTGPLSETVAASIAAGYNKRDGYTRNLATGNKSSDRNRWFMRGQLLFAPDNGLKVRLIGDYGKIDEFCCGVFNVVQGMRTGMLISPPISGRVNTPAQLFDNAVYTNFDSTNKVENYGVSGQIDYEFGPMTLTSITAYRRGKTKLNFDTDFTSADLLRGANIGFTDLKTFTQEIRLQANFVDRINVLVGGFYFNEKVAQGTRVEWGANARAYANTLVRGPWPEHRLARGDLRYADRQSGAIHQPVLRRRPVAYRGRPAEGREFLDLQSGRFQGNRPPDADRRGQLHQRQEAFQRQSDVHRRLCRARHSRAAQSGESEISRTIGGAWWTCKPGANRCICLG